MATPTFHLKRDILMNTELIKPHAGFAAFIETFKTIDSMSREFVEGKGADYLLRLAARYRHLEPQERFEKILRAFTPTSNTFRLEQELAGSVTGAQKALSTVLFIGSQLTRLGRLANPQTHTVWAKPGELLCPDLIQYCASTRNRDMFAHHWIGVADGLDYDAIEISQMMLFILDELMPLIVEFKDAFNKKHGLR